MKTASFFSYIGPGRISIARRAPRTLEPGYRVYRPLAPGPWFNSVGYERYCELYDDQLARLSARVVWDELQKLAAPHEPVLLCWERPPFALPRAADPKGNWCHSACGGPRGLRASSAIPSFSPAQLRLVRHHMLHDA
jgi:hypothetical protein